MPSHLDPESLPTKVAWSHLTCGQVHSAPGPFPAGDREKSGEGWAGVCVPSALQTHFQKLTMQKALQTASTVRLTPPPSC